MDNGSTVPYHSWGAKEGRSRKPQPLNGLRCQARAPEKGQANPSWRQARDGGAYGPQVQGRCCQEKLLSDEPRMPVPQTDTGRRVENTKANGRTLVKELGKMAP